MHPEVRRIGPGNCPICGMALEPVVASAETGPSPELVDMTCRFWIGLALSLPVFVLEMGAHLVDLHRVVAPQASNWIQLLLATPVVLWAGWPFFLRAVASVKNRSLNMFTLIALGTGAAWVYSIIASVAPGSFRRSSAAAMRNIRQTLFFSFAYNVAGIPLAAGVLYPFFVALLSPVVAAAAMALSSVSAIGNALRLRTVDVS
jgi:cation transport ATPase